MAVSLKQKYKRRSKRRSVMLDRGSPKPRRDLDLDPYVRRLKGCYATTRPVTKGPNGRNECRWCGREVPPPKQTFCSADCVHEWKLRTSGGYVRAQLQARDDGRCAVCGIDTYRLQEMLDPDFYRRFPVFLKRRGLEPHISQYRLTPEDREAWDRYRRKVRDHAERLRRRIDSVWSCRRSGSRNDLWDADHIVRVVDGGGCCGVENMQTLCVRCHGVKTARR